MNHTAKLILAVAASFVIGIASTTFAEGVVKKDNAPGKMCPSCLNQRGMHGFRGHMGSFPASKALTEEQVSQLEAQRAEFHSATRDLRQELKSKRLALRSELAKKEPDSKTAMALQKDISTLNSELGQKRIEHVLAMKKIAPYGGMGQFKDNREDPMGGCFRRM